MTSSGGQEDRQQEGEIRRILVALDASPPSLAALRAAAELAARLDAELVGLFVEDITLLRLAELPFARETSLLTRSSQEFNREHIEQHLRSRARQARRALQALANRQHLRWSFRVAKGIIARELLNAAEEYDLIILGKSGWSRRRRLGSTARVLISEAPHQAMILQQGAHLGLPIGVIYDGSSLSRKALSEAVHLLFHREGWLVVLILASTQERAQALQKEIGLELHGRGLHVHFRWLVNADSTRLSELARGEKVGLLIVPGETQILQGEALADLLNRTEVPVLVLR